MTDKARELLERAIEVLDFDRGLDADDLMEEIRAYLAEPEVEVEVERMSNVIEFKQRHFKSGTVRCEHCAHEWVAVWPVNSEPLECPKCGLLRGREFYGPSLYDYVKLPNGAIVTDALDAYFQGVKEGKKLASEKHHGIGDNNENTNP